MHIMTSRLLILLSVVVPVLCTHAEDRPGLEGISWQSFEGLTNAEHELINALREPLLEARTVDEPLNAWFRGRLLALKNQPAAAEAAWREGLAVLAEGGFERLPKTEWGPLPDADFEFLESVPHPRLVGAECRIVRWSVDGLAQYGVLLTPEGLDVRAEGASPHPLILYLHGAAYGVPYHVLPWLGKMAAEGYVIVGPALRGEDLFAGYLLPPDLPEYRCEGQIENLDGEVDDAVAAVEAARKLPGVRNQGFAMLGHSFGAGVGLLAAARHPETRCAVSYDAWLVNPFRYYWDRMRRGPNNWLSWAAFCNQPAEDQLAGLMHRSIVHNADRLHCPLLMFIGGAYQGSVFHKSHADLIERLRKNNRPYIYDIVEGGGHNFVLYTDSSQALYAYEQHMAFLRKHWPPMKKTQQDEDPGKPGE